MQTGEKSREGRRGELSRPAGRSGPNGGSGGGVRANTLKGWRSSVEWLRQAEPLLLHSVKDFRRIWRVLPELPKGRREVLLINHQRAECYHQTLGGEFLSEIRNFTKILSKGKKKRSFCSLERCKSCSSHSFSIKLAKRTNTNHDCSGTTAQD